MVSKGWPATNLGFTLYAILLTYTLQVHTQNDSGFNFPYMGQMERTVIQHKGHYTNLLSFCYHSTVCICSAV